jgi:tetratricopeptide (TPR) repeat protein
MRFFQPYAAWGLAILGLIAYGFTLGIAPPETSVLDDPLVRAEGRAGLERLYDLDFATAQMHFSRITRRYPDHPIGPFLTGLNLWWQMLQDLSDRSRDKAFYGLMDAVIAQCDRRLRRNPQDLDALFFKSAALGFRGRLRSNRGDWFRAALDGKRALDAVMALARLRPQNPDFRFGKALYDYYAAVIPERYPFTKPVMSFFPSGNRTAGLRQIEETARQGYYLQPEAVYFLAMIYYLFEEDYSRTLEQVRWLREHYPNNGYFHALEGRVYIRWGRWAQGRQTFEKVLERYQKGQRGYHAAQAEQALYFIALSYMMERRYETALSYLLQLEALTARRKEDTYFKVMGRLRQGMVYDALGRRDIARLRYREVLQMKDFGNAQERARAYLQRPFRG